MGQKQNAFLEESIASVRFSTPNSICLAATSGKGVPVALRARRPQGSTQKGR